MEQIKFCLLLRCKFFMTHLSCKEEEFVVRSYCVDYSDDWASWIFFKNTLIIEAKKKKKTTRASMLASFPIHHSKNYSIEGFFLPVPPHSHILYRLKTHKTKWTTAKAKGYICQAYGNDGLIPAGHCPKSPFALLQCCFGPGWHSLWLFHSRFQALWIKSCFPEAQCSMTSSGKEESLCGLFYSSETLLSLAWANLLLLAFTAVS